MCSRMRCCNDDALMNIGQTAAQFRRHRPPGPVRRAACALAPFLLAVWVHLAAAGPPTYHASLNTAMAAAAADQSLVLLIFGAEWCGPCQLLKSNTLSAPAFVRQESALHIAEVDIDANQKTAHDFAVEAVPTLILLTGEGKIIERQTGFMEIGELLKWLQEGRRRATAGEWEGTVPGPQIAEFTKKAAADALGTNDLEKLAGMLGETDPADRASAADILLAQREQAVPALIAAVTNSYLGVRIGASELLQQLAPGLDPVDPWQSPVELSTTVAGLQTWWAETGRLPAPAARPAVDLRSDNAVKEALEQLRSDDPGRRTAAMTLLAGQGVGVLPAVRAAVKRAEGTGDLRTLGLLEDVRWTLLVPDALEQHGNGVRQVLARGKSSERQAMTERLGHFGRDALGPLAELAGDSDPMVVESAVRALSDIGGDEAVLALAGLLQAGDSNLRMTAAQALGHTKNSKAVKPLLTVINDPNEVVACAALSALEETQARDTYSPAQKEPPLEITAGLKLSLADTRWRVRAAAAEIAGKLGADALKDELKKLLDDPDGFVVKSALTALGKLNAAPEPAQLIALSKRLPGLQGDAVAVLLQSASEDTAKTVTDLYDSSTAVSRVAILKALAQRETPGDAKLDDAWKPLLTEAITAPDPRLRRSAAETLRNLAPKLGADLVDPLLADEDRETRLAAAVVVVRILDQDNHSSLSPRTSSASGSAKTNQPFGTTAKLAAWHAALQQHPEPAPTLGWAAALYITGDGKTDLPVLQAALGQPEGGAGQSRTQREMNLAVMGLVLHKLPWPEGRPVVDTMAASPVWLAVAASQSGQGRPAVRDELLEPARFKSAMARADGPALTEALELLAGYDYVQFDEHSSWSLWTDSAATKAITLALAGSTNAAWRAAAIFSLARGRR